MTIPDPPLWCDRCAAPLRPGLGELYEVRIEAIADPSPPRFTAEDLAQDPGREIGRLLDHLRDVTEIEAMEQVCRRVVLHLCIGCYRGWIENPTGS